MRNILLLLVGASLCSLVFGSEDRLFASLDEQLPIAEVEIPSAEMEFDTRASRALQNDTDLRIYDFYHRRRPTYVREIPEPTNGERLIWKLGDTIRNLKAPSGEFSIIRVKSRDDGFHIRYLGRLQSDGRHATISEAITEILPGDRVVRERFQVNRLPPATGDGGLAPKPTRVLGSTIPFFEPTQDESLTFSGTRQLIGAKFVDYRGGNTVSLGGSFVIRREGEEIARGIVVDADLDLATLYIYESTREVRADDEIFAQ